MTTKSNHYCCVPQCKSWAKKDVEKVLSFHQFPPENVQKVWYQTAVGRELIDRRKAWTLKLDMGKPVTAHMKVCSLHFCKDDYVSKGKRTGSGRILKTIAVPSQNLPTSTVPSMFPTPSTSCSERYKKKCQDLKIYSPCKEEPLTMKSPCKEEPSTMECPFKEEPSTMECCFKEEPATIECPFKEEPSTMECPSKEDIYAAKCLLALDHSKPHPTKAENRTRDVAVQVNIDRIYTLGDLIKMDSALKSFTGNRNLQIFDCILDMTQQVYHDTHEHRLSIIKKE